MSIPSLSIAIVDLERVVVNITANLFGSAAIEYIFPKQSSSKNVWLQLFEGMIALALHTMIVPTFADGLLGFSAYDSFDRVSALALGYFLMGNAVGKIRYFKDDVILSLLPTPLVKDEDE